MRLFAHRAPAGRLPRGPRWQAAVWVATSWLLLFAGRMTASDFLAVSRPWERYATDYRPPIVPLPPATSIVPPTTRTTRASSTG